MKIGILTYSAAHNFGAILQCYGLYHTVKSLGHEVEVIDYRPQYLSTYEPKFGIRQVINRHIKSLSERWRQYRYWREVYDGYNNFKSEEMVMSEPVYNPDELRTVIQQFDIVIVGSDQIWNPQFNGNDNAWFGDLNATSVKWISYAASAGNPQNIERFQDLHNLLNNFSSISVRERELADILKNYTGEVYPTVIDPSLLSDISCWGKWIKPVEKGEYIVTYQARESDDTFRIANAISRQLGNIRIIPLDFYGNVSEHGYATRITDPQGFISLIKNARCVVTTSFHGTAFSIILKTPFYTLRLNDGADNRSENLLKSLDLESRMIAASETPIFSEIDFDSPHFKLNALRENSLRFLKKALS